MNLKSSTAVNTSPDPSDAPPAASQDAEKPSSTEQARAHSQRQDWHEDRPRKPQAPARGFIPLFDPPKAPRLRAWTLILGSVLALMVFTITNRSDDRSIADVAASDNVVIQARQAANLMSVEQEDSFLGPMRALAVTPNATRRVATTWAALDRGDGTRSLIALSIMARIPEQVAGGAPLGAPAGLDPTLIQAFMYPDELGEQEREYLIDHVGWPARLLFVRSLPDGDPQKTTLYSEAESTNRWAGIVVLMQAIAGVAGMIWLARFWTARRRRQVKFELEPAHSDTDVYLESFAVYLGCFAVGGALRQSLGGALPLLPPLIQLGGSVVGVFWPALRGVPLGVMARDLGFHRGQGWVTELRAGLVGYAVVLPFFAAGVIVMMLARVFVDAVGLNVAAPLHPDMVGLGETTLTQRFVLLLVVAVLAPLFEEAMFRGALFRALRARWGFWASAIVGSLVFAAVHPQGLLAIPPLAALAIGFAGLREWRSSLIAPMLAHALHNSFLVLLSSILLS